VLLRQVRGWNQNQFAARTGIAASQISDYEQGYRVISRRHLERMAEAAGFPRALLDPLLQVLRFFRLATEGRMREERLLQLSHLSSRVLALAHAAADLIAPKNFPPRSALFPRPSPDDRVPAEAFWLRLRARSPVAQQAMIEELPEARTWAVVERISRASIEAAGAGLHEALRLASLAVTAARLIPGSPAGRSRALGYAYAHLANAERVCGDLRSAEATLAEAKALWAAGADAGAPGLLNGVWIIWIEAALRHIQGRPQTALLAIEEALAADQGDLRGRLLYTKARIMEALDRFDESTALLREAARCIELAGDPRFGLGVTIQLAVNLWEQGEIGEAEAYLPEVERFAAAVDQEPDWIRVRWLQGRIAAGRDRFDDARTRFEQVRRYFEMHGVAYDFSVVSLELSLVLLKIGQPAEVRRVSSDLIGIFCYQGLPENALAALHLFCEAVRQEEATIELTERVLRFLRRAARDPSAIFTLEG
jgi:transcriptional regulator with XRE-family HTH domain